MTRYLFEDIPEPGRLREISPRVYWLRMPLPLALDHINLYLLEEDDGWWVVDTGMGLEPTRRLWERALAEQMGGKPIKAVVATHHHPDHIGMVGWLCDRFRAPFYMTRDEYFTGLAFVRLRDGDLTWTFDEHMHRVGCSTEQAQATRRQMGGFREYSMPMPSSYRRLQEGDSLRVDGHSWRVLVGRGHSPEHACLYSESHNILISGDQVIPRISTNVSVTGVEPEANPLKDWLYSLERFLDLLPEDVLVLPAHNEPFFGLHQRLRQLCEHHEEHLLALEQACAERASSVLELLPVLFRQELTEQQTQMAVGECLAHLNYLLHRGQLSRQIDASGIYRFRSIDESLPQRLRQRRPEPDDAPPIQV